MSDLRKDNRRGRHSFVICAYRESPFLEACIRSVRCQTVQSGILLSTSTPNDYIEKLCEKYDIPVKVNCGEKGITGDWNHALSVADSEFVTLAHQDDVYCKTYTERMLNGAHIENASIIFSDYFEIRDGKRCNSNMNLRIKRVMNCGFRWFGNSRVIRRRVLSLGNPICCPSVTYNMNCCGDFRFDKRFRVSCDWEAWSRLAERDNRFVYIPESLMGHRIHAGSETTTTIADNTRYREDLAMYCRYWPENVARLLLRGYAKSQDGNRLS